MLDNTDLLEKTSIAEFKELALQVLPSVPNIIKKDELLTFPCLFPEEHSDLKNANAYAFKKDGMYFAKCHGEVCSHRYEELNRQLKDIQLNKIDFKTTRSFDIDDNGVTVYLAPTGWGKTETIADECLTAVNDGRKLVVVLQNIEAIHRLIGRMGDRSGEHEKVKSMVDNDIIYVFTAENKDDYKVKFEKARVIITHHYYFKNAGDILTKYQSTVDLLNLPNVELIIDEAHTLLELSTKIDLQIGGLYEKHSYDGLVTYRKNRKSLLNEDLAETTLIRKTDVIEPKLNDYGNVDLTFNHKLYDDVKYIDIYTAVRERLTLVNTFNEEYMQYQYYKNYRPSEPNINSLDSTKGVIDDLVEPCDYAVIGVNIGDDIKRRNIGDFNITFHHYQIINEILNKPKKVILTTATMNDYHYHILDRVVKYNVIDIKDKIEKVKTIVLLRNVDKNSSRKRSTILGEIDDNNIPSLLFMPTIAKAKRWLSILKNSMLNDNGIYSIGERKSATDYLDNVARNITLVGLESSVAKGYNYLEETQGGGFEVIYFDNEPVSPPTIKKYPQMNDTLKDYKSTYNISTFAQAIGRAFRKDKQVLTLAFNKIEDETFEDIIEYLDSATNSRVITDELNLTNLKIATFSMVKNENYEIISKRLQNNELFASIYESDEDKIEEDVDIDERK